MGFLGLISAKKLAATYDVQAHQLILYAQGEVKEATYGIQFARVQMCGGLAYQLQGWTGPITGKVEPYTYDQRINIQLPNPVCPSNTVIIMDLDSPKGVVVHINFTGDFHPSNIPNKPTEAAKSTNGVQQMALPDIKINVLFKEPFEIQQSSQVPKFGEVNVVFDTNYLQLQEAGIRDNSIVWTFNSLQTGYTQVRVIDSGGITPIVTIKDYDVRIFVLDSTAVTSHQNRQSGLPLSFLGFVNIAVRKVQKEYPNAQLYEVDATPPSEGVTDPYLLSQLKVVFRAGSGTAIIKSTGWGSFGPVDYIPESWLEDVVIPWPVNMDAKEANAIMRNAGYTTPYSAMTLRHPLYPGDNEPYYIFCMTNGTFVFVGVQDKKVSVNKAGQAIAPASRDALLKKQAA